MVFGGEDGWTRTPYEYDHEFFMRPLDVLVYMV